MITLGQLLTLSGILFAISVAGIFLNRKNRVFAIDDAYTIKNNLLMNVRGGFTRQLFPERRRSQGFDLSSLGFSNSLIALVPADLATFPNVTFDNFQAFSPWESGDGFFMRQAGNSKPSAVSIARRVSSWPGS